MRIYSVWGLQESDTADYGAVHIKIMGPHPCIKPSAYNYLPPGILIIIDTIPNGLEPGCINVMYCKLNFKVILTTLDIIAIGSAAYHHGVLLDVSNRIFPAACELFHDVPVAGDRLFGTDPRWQRVIVFARFVLLLIVVHKTCKRSCLCIWRNLGRTLPMVHVHHLFLLLLYICLPAHPQNVCCQFPIPLVLTALALAS